MSYPRFILDDSADSVAKAYDTLEGYTLAQILEIAKRGAEDPDSVTVDEHNVIESFVLINNGMTSNEFVKFVKKD